MKKAEPLNCVCQPKHWMVVRDTVELLNKLSDIETVHYMELNYKKAEPLSCVLQVYPMQAVAK